MNGDLDDLAVVRNEPAIAVLVALPARFGERTPVNGELPILRDLLVGAGIGASLSVLSRFSSSSWSDIDHSCLAAAVQHACVRLLDSTRRQVKCAYHMQITDQCKAIGANKDG